MRSAKPSTIAVLPVLDLRKQYATVFDEVIERGIKEGVFHVEQPFIVRMAILGAMNWIQQWYKSQGTLTKNEIQMHYQQLILKLLK